MNFYEFYNLINEYGQNIIDSLIRKYQKEEPGLSSEVIKNYIDRFERIKNNFPERDITKYSWSELETAVDGYNPKERIRAGRLKSTVTDANLLYNQNNVRIYLGKDKKSCVRYGNGYTFCVSARGERNLYGHYRILKQGTPYFIFNDSISERDNRHLIVLFVYKNAGKLSPLLKAAGHKESNSYSVTLADNKGDKKFKFIDDIILKYPWISPIKEWIQDDTKGHVPVDPYEIIDHYLGLEYERKKFLLLNKHNDLYSLLDEFSISNSLLRKQTKHIEEFLNGKKRLGTFNIFAVFSENDWPSKEISSETYFRPYNASGAFIFYTKPEEIIKSLENELKEACLQISHEYSRVTVNKPTEEDTLPNLAETKKIFKEKEQKFLKMLSENKRFSYDTVDLEKMQLNGDFYNKDHNGLVVMPYFVIFLGSPEDKAKNELLKDKSLLNQVLNIHKEYNKQKAWIISSPVDIVRVISDKILENGGQGPIEEYPDISISDLIKSYM